MDSICKNRLIVTQFNTHRQEYQDLQTKVLKASQRQQLAELDLNDENRFVLLEAIYNQKPKQLEGEIHETLVHYRDRLAKQDQRQRTTIDCAFAVLDTCVSKLTEYRE